MSWKHTAPGPHNSMGTDGSGGMMMGSMSSMPGMGASGAGGGHHADAGAGSSSLPHPLPAGHHGHDMGGMAGMGDGMAMYFTQSSDVTVVFRWCRSTGPLSYAALLLGVFALALLYEWALLARRHRLRRSLQPGGAGSGSGWHDALRSACDIGWSGGGERTKDGERYRSVPPATAHTTDHTTAGGALNVNGPGGTAGGIESKSGSGGSGGGGGGVGGGGGGSGNPPRDTMVDRGARIAAAVSHAATAGLGYVVMLVTMTFNASSPARARAHTHTHTHTHRRVALSASPPPLLPPPPFRRPSLLESNHGLLGGRAPTYMCVWLSPPPSTVFPQNQNHDSSV